MTNSAEGALSAPEALKLRMQEMNRSKAALASNVPSQSQLDVVVSGNGSALGSSALGGVQPSSNKQISFNKGLGGYFGAGESGGSAMGGHGGGGSKAHHHHHHHGGAGGQHQPNNQSQSSSNHS